jgi:hypothetical protein
MAELGPRLGAEAQKRIVAALPGALGEELGKIAADPNPLMKDPGKALEGAREDLKQELTKKLPTSQPGELLKDPGKAVEGLGDLLGKKKEKKEKAKQ